MYASVYVHVYAYVGQSYYWNLNSRDVRMYRQCMTSLALIRRPASWGYCGCTINGRDGGLGGSLFAYQTGMSELGI